MMNETISVLFVDDEEGNLSSYKRNYRREFKTFLANSPAEALELLTKEHIDVIVSDQRMPGMTGVEFLELVKDTHPGIMRILITGYTDVEAIVNAINKAKIYNYIPKPFAPEELLAQINQAFLISQQQQEMERLAMQFAQLKDWSAEPCMTFDSKGKLIDMNSATIPFFAMDEKSLNSKGFEAFGPDNPHLWEELMRTEGSKPVSFDFVNAIGHKKQIFIRCSTIKPAGSNVSYHMVMLTDPEAISSRMAKSA